MISSMRGVDWRRQRRRSNQTAHQLGAEVIAYCEQLAARLRHCRHYDRNIEVVVDLGPERASAKRWHWRRKGVPLQTVVGIREIRENNISMSRRDRAAVDADVVPVETITDTVPLMPRELDCALLESADMLVKSRCVAVSTLEEMASVFEGEDDAIGSYALASFDVSLDGTEKVERVLKQWRVTPRCIVDSESGSQGQCLFSGKTVSGKVPFARAY